MVAAGLSYGARDPPYWTAGHPPPITEITVQNWSSGACSLAPSVAPPVRTLGAEYFPRFAEANLRVDAGEVAALLREYALLREHLHTVACIG